MLLPNWSILRAKELIPAERHLLHVIKLHIGKNAFATVGHECLAGDTGLSRQTIIRLTKSLELKGWITITKRRHHSNGYVVHEYRLVPEAFNRTFTSNHTSSVISDDKAIYNDFTEVCKTTLHKDTKIKTEETKIKEKAFADKSATPSQSPQTTEPIGREEVENELTSSSTKTNTPPVICSVLENIYRTRITELFQDNSYEAPLTAKQRKQLNDYIKRLGDNDPIKIFDTVVSNWGKFLTYMDGLNICGSYKCLPKIPSIRFMLTNVSHTVNFVLYREKLKSVGYVVKPSKPKISGAGIAIKPSKPKITESGIPAIKPSKQKIMCVG